MAKKNFGLGKILAAVAALLGLVALIMLFVPQLTPEKGDSLNGLKITFGYSEEVLGKDVKILDFSFGNFLTYVLVLVGIVFAVLALLGKLGKIAPIVATVAFVVAGVFFFLALTFTAVHTELEGELADKAVEAFKDLYSLGAGAIVGGILSILAGLASAASMFIKK